MEESSLRLRAGHKKTPDRTLSTETGEELQSYHELGSWTLQIILKLFLILPNYNNFKV